MNPRNRNTPWLAGWAAALLLACWSRPIAAEPATWQIDSAHSTARFTVRHLMIANVHGEFSKLTGQIRGDEQELSDFQVEATIDAATIDTRDPKRDEHLRSPDFFDVANHPSIQFKSQQAHKDSGGTIWVTGELTIRGVTKPVTLEIRDLSPVIRDPWGNTKRGVTATTKINRQDFGVSWNRALDTGGVLVSDEVSITIDLELARKDPSQS
jgi:polyisoprenoid-binding protein YceI